MGALFLMGVVGLVGSFYNWGASLYSYNREAFMTDMEMKQERRYWNDQLKISESSMHREDIRDLAGTQLTILNNWILVETLILELAGELIVEGELPEATVDFVANAYMICLGSTLLYLVIAIGLAVIAALQASTVPTDRLTKRIRPAWARYKSMVKARRKQEETEAFEGQPGSRVFMPPAWPWMKRHFLEGSGSNGLSQSPPRERSSVGSGESVQRSMTTAFAKRVASTVSLKAAAGINEVLGLEDDTGAANTDRQLDGEIVDDTLGEEALIQERWLKQNWNPCEDLWKPYRDSSMRAFVLGAKNLMETYGYLSLAQLYGPHSSAWAFWLVQLVFAFINACWGVFLKGCFERVCIVAGPVLLMVAASTGDPHVDKICIPLGFLLHLISNWVMIRGLLLDKSLEAAETCARCMSCGLLDRVQRMLKRREPRREQANAADTEAFPSFARSDSFNRAESFESDTGPEQAGCCGGTSWSNLASPFNEMMNGRPEDTGVQSMTMPSPLATATQSLSNIARRFSLSGLPGDDAEDRRCKLQESILRPQQRMTGLASRRPLLVTLPEEEGDLEDGLRVGPRSQSCSSIAGLDEPSSEPAIVRSIRRRHLDVVLLLQAYDECRDDMGKRLFWEPDELGCTPLHTACQEACLDLVEILLQEPDQDAIIKTIEENHPELDDMQRQELEQRRLEFETARHRFALEAMLQRDQHSCTPLHLACIKGDPDIVKELFEQAGSEAAQAMLLKSSDGRTPLHCACISGHAAVVKALIEICTKSNEKAFHDAFCQAARCRDKSDCTPFELACEAGHGRVVQVLLEVATQGKGASPSSVSSEQDSAQKEIMRSRMNQKSARSFLNSAGFLVCLLWGIATAWAWDGAIRGMHFKNKQAVWMNPSQAQVEWKAPNLKIESRFVGVHWPSVHFQPEHVACGDGHLFLADHFRVYEIVPGLLQAGSEPTTNHTVEPQSCQISGAIEDIASSCKDGSCTPVVLQNGGGKVDHSIITDCATGIESPLTQADGYAQRLASGKAGTLFASHGNDIIEYEKDANTWRPRWSVAEVDEKVLQAIDATNEMLLVFSAGKLDVLQLSTGRSCGVWTLPHEVHGGCVIGRKGLVLVRDHGRPPQLAEVDIPYLEDCAQMGAAS